jgi:hypothetical protein
MVSGLATVWACAGCEAPRGPVSIDSEDPDLKVLAIKRDVALHDEKDIPQMVRDLDDVDPAIRFYAIQGLRHLTGDAFGYRYYDDQPARAPAIARWKAWLTARHGV